MPGHPTRRRALGLALAALGGLTLRLPLGGRAHAQGDAAEPAEGNPWGVPPVSLAIPRLGVEADIVPVGLDPEGLMDVPPHPDLVAWFEYGPGMGVPGNAVFAAHVDWGGRPRVFHQLGALEAGDAVLVVDAEGRGFEYLVRSRHLYDAEDAPVEEIFAQTVDPVITLITCGGRYQEATREYLDRIVVVAKGA